MKLPIYSQRIEVVQLVDRELHKDIYGVSDFETISGHRGFEIYVDDVLVAYGPTITYWPEDNRP